MVNLTIDGKAISVKEGTTILEAAKSANIEIPTLCYLAEINEIGACRICVVELEGNENLVASCQTRVEEGMSVLTNSHRVRRAREINLELLLSTHNTQCTSCVRSGNCTLQTLSEDLNINTIPYEIEYPKNNWDQSLPIIRDRDKCIKCMRCIAVCDKVQGVGVWELIGTGHRTTVGVKDRKSLTAAQCAMCGQCITHCPVGALHERDDTRKVEHQFGKKPEKIVIAQVAPAVRSAWAKDLGISDPKDATVGKMVAAMRHVGFDYVFDTDFTADLTIMEEGSELLERLAHKDDYSWPMFTSCCPGWVRYAKLKYPEFLPNLSTAKSPQQMFGAVAKTYFAEKLGKNPEDIVCVSVMPCTAKKYECDVPEVNSSGAKDVDIVLTTRELARMIKSTGLKINELQESEFDKPLGMGTGAGVIFGTTGGVMEAALRSAHYLVTGKNPDADAFSEIRGMDGWRERTVKVGDVELKLAIAHGLGNTEKLLEAIKAGKASYDFVEIMACPTGCAGGGGQPITDGAELGEARGEVLRNLDKSAPLRFSHENPFVQTLYAEYLEKPLGEKSHHLLHTDQSKWTIE